MTAQQTPLQKATEVAWQWKTACESAQKRVEEAVVLLGRFQERAHELEKEVENWGKSGKEKGDKIKEAATKIATLVGERDTLQKAVQATEAKLKEATSQAESLRQQAQQSSAQIIGLGTPTTLLEIPEQIVEEVERLTPSPQPAAKKRIPRPVPTSTPPLPDIGERAKDGEAVGLGSVQPDGTGENRG